MKILYVCPFAHYSGHPPSAAIHEPYALTQAGAEVELLTFYGIIDKTKVGVAHKSVIPRTKLFAFLERLISFLIIKIPFLRWFLLFFANVWTVVSAMRLKRRLDYDIIYLRDGDPFLFIPIILSLPFSGYKWVISLMGGGLNGDSVSLLETLKKNLSQFVYRVVSKGVNSKLWRPLYQYSLKKNLFLFVVQNNAVEEGYNSYLDGVFSGKVVCVKMGCNKTSQNITKEEARRYLSLPQNITLLLSFGATHPSKDLVPIFQAVADIPNIFLVQAGKYTFSIGQDPQKLSKDYAMAGKLILRDNYIPEAEKPYYFFAADAIVLSYAIKSTCTASLLWDACCFKTPVIASDNGQLGELVKKYKLGLSFVAQDATSLRETILQFIKLKPCEVEVFKDNCRRFSDEFSMERWAKNTLNVIGDYV